MIIQSGALQQLILGLNIATAQHRSGVDTLSVFQDFQPGIARLQGEAGEVEPGLAPLIEPFTSLSDDATPETVSAAFYEASVQLLKITGDSDRSGLSMLADDMRKAWRSPRQRVIEVFRSFHEESPEPMGVLEWHGDGSAELVTLNRINRDFQGLDEKEITGVSVFRFFHPETEPLVRAFIKDIGIKGNAFAAGVRMRRHSGEEILVDMRATRIGSSRYAHFSVVNETPREKAMSLNQIVEAALSRTDDAIVLFKFYANGRPEGILTSAGFSRMLGYNNTEMEDAGVKVLDAIPQSAHATLGRHLQRFNETGTFDWQEAPLVKRNGEQISVDIYAKAVEVKGTKYAFGFFRDAKERLDSERAAVEAQQLELFHKLAGRLAHDINNNLTIVLAGVTLDDDQNDPELRETISQMILMSSKSLTSFRRLTDSHAQDEPVNMNEQQSEWVIRLATGQLSSDVDIQFDLEPEPWLVAGPDNSFQQIQLNIIKNAMEAMAESPIKRLNISTEKIRIQSEDVIRRLDPTRSFPKAQPGDYMKLSITDTGAGIPPDFLPEIFKDFTSSKSGDDANRGRGLAASHRAVKARGGIDQRSIDTRERHAF